MTPAEAWQRLRPKVDASHPLADDGHGAPRFSLLQAGRVNQTWRLDRGIHSGFVRIGGPLGQRLGLNRESEPAVLSLVASAGIGPACLAADAEAGLLLTEWLPGIAMTEGVLALPANLARVAQLLAKLHSLPLAGATVDYRAEAVRYAELGGPGQTDRCRAALGILGRLEPGSRVLTHRDVVAANFIVDGPGLRMVDWEYAGLGSRWFDLAVLAVHLGLDEPARGQLLTSYLAAAGSGIGPTRGTVEPSVWASIQLAGWARFYVLLQELWLAATNDL